MGAGASTGSQIRANLHPTSEKGARSSSPINRKRAAVESGNIQVARERGNFPTDHTHYGELHLKDVSDSQEGRYNETDNRPQGIKQICPLRAFQDGRNPSDTDAIARGRLDGEVRPKRRLLCDIDKPLPQEVPGISVSGSHIPVQLPTVWSHIRPESIHKDNETSHSVAKTVGLSNDQLHRRQPDPGLIRARSQTLGRVGNCTSRRTGFHSQLRQVLSRPSSKHALPGFQHRLQNNDSQCSHRQANKVAEHSETPRETGRSVRTDLSNLHWHSVIHEAGNSTSTAVLPSPTGGKELHQPALTEYRQSSPTRPSPEGGARMVDRAGSPVEQSLTLSSEADSKDPNGCLKNRLGGSMPGNLHRRPVDTTGDAIPHQLPRTTSGFPGNSDLYQESEGHNDPHSDRQCTNNVIYQPKGRDPLPLTDTIGQDNMVMVHGKEHSSPSRTHSGCGQYPGRQGIPSNDRSLGLEVGPPGLQRDQQAPGTIPGGPICFKSVNPAGEILQLEAGPISRGDGCLSPNLEGTILCQPTLGLGTSGLDTGSNTEGQHCTDCPSVEDTGMVPITIAAPVRLPDTNTSQGHDDTSSQPAPVTSSGTGSTVGRMAYIRRSCKAGNLSDEATQLLMASWRSKSQSSYNSLFHKWEGWCSQRKRNPIFGPVEDVANFLAYLFEKGYSYSSLNSYRSAISSVHERVEGVPVGQHPTVTRILKGAYNIRPPKPRYKETWKVSQVIQWLDSQRNESLLELSMKAVTLCALTRPCRSAELAAMDVDSIRFSPEGVRVLPIAPPKQARAGNAIKDYFFPQFEQNINICPVTTLRKYCDRSRPNRPTGVKHLFITTRKPFHPASSATIARWIKSTLSKAGIDTSIFCAHSTKSASTSAAADAGISIPEILAAADWSSNSVFERFYYRPQSSSKFGVTVLKTASNLQS